MRTQTNFAITVSKRLKLYYFLSPGFSLDERIFKDSGGKLELNFGISFILKYTSLGYHPNMRGITDI